LYARSTSAKLDVGSTTPSLRRRTPDADIKHYYSVINATMY
ncbi:MAG: PadR family transcriptional regulator, partial [Hungatella sp.]|nr:PadR family transcriptional regulator [Hungatella sp.]